MRAAGLVRNSYKGSLTVFYAMTLMMALSIVFTMVEGVRYSAYQSQLQQVTDLLISSEFSDYNRILYQRYGVMGIDMGYGENTLDVTKAEDRILSWSETCCNPDTGTNVDFLRKSCESCSITEYGLLTDNGGSPYLKLAVRSTTGGAAYYAASKLSENLLEHETVRESTDLGFDVSNEIENGLSYLSNGEEVAQGISLGLLNLAIEDASSLSTKSFQIADRLTDRTLNRGTANGEAASAVEKYLFQQYLLDTYGSYTKDGFGKMEYELEYLLCGKSTDKDNLEGVLGRLLLVREAANLITLRADSTRMAEARAWAEAMALLLGQPEMGEAITTGIVAAWTYAESVMDLRTLLSGGHISVNKSSSEWTCGLAEIIPSLQNYRLSAECSGGWSYTDYLGSLLLLQSQKTTVYRAMDLAEYLIRGENYYENFRLDHCIYECNLSCLYKARPIFLSFVTLIHTDGLSSYEYERRASLSYL